MAYNVKVGTVTKTTDTGVPVTQAVTGLGFQPKAIMVWTYGRAGDATLRSAIAGASIDVLRPAIGFAADVGGGEESGVAAFFGVGANVDFNGGQRAATSRFIELVTASGALVASASIDSFDADGFTFNWQTNNAEAVELHYLALGGSDLTDVALLDWTMPVAAGNKAVTGAGFTPDCVIHIHAGAVTATTGDDAQLGIGVMEGADEWAATFSDNDGEQVTDAASRGQIVDGCILEIDPATQVIDARASFVSMDADGFTTNFSVSPGAAHRVFSLCLAGGAYKAGSFAKTTGDVQTVRGLNMEPLAVLLASYGGAGSPEVLLDVRMGLGASDGTDDAAAAVDDPDDLLLEMSGYSRSDRALAYVDGPPATPVFVTATVERLLADEIDLIWRQNTADADLILYLALGTDLLSTPITGVTVTPHGDKCNAGEATLPYLDVCWDQIVPGGAETFVQYNIYRREAGATDWARIATVTAVATVCYRDFNVSSYQGYEYAVTWTATVSGSDRESARQVTAGRVDFDHVFVHEVGDAGDHHRADDADLEVARNGRGDGIRLARPRGDAGLGQAHHAGRAAPPAGAPLRRKGNRRAHRGHRRV
ncbi:hypothetical protein LCGC14_1161510, partial [marine sediment metagenome]